MLTTICKRYVLERNYYLSIERHNRIMKLFARGRGAFLRRQLNVTNLLRFTLLFCVLYLIMLAINNRTEICTYISWPHKADYEPLRLKMDQHPAGIKIYDTFLFNDELDLLELRLEAHYQYVDYFIITESIVTFTGLPKPLHYAENKQRFSKYNDKVIHYVVPAEELARREPRFPRESYARDYAIARIGCDSGDVIIISDLDTYLRPHVLTQLKTESAQFMLPASLFYKNHIYSFSWVVENSFYGHKRQVKSGTAIDCKNAKLLGGQNAMRMPVHAGHSIIENAGWHCSFCLTTEGIMSKLASYSHRWNLEDINEDKVQEAIDNGISLFNADKEEFKPNDDPLDIPEYLLNYPQKFSYLLGKQVAKLIQSDAAKD